MQSSSIHSEYCSEIPPGGRAVVDGLSVGSVGYCRSYTRQLSLATVVAEVVGERRPRKLNGP